MCDRSDPIFWLPRPGSAGAEPSGVHCPEAYSVRTSPWWRLRDVVKHIILARHRATPMRILDGGPTGRVGDPVALS